MEVEMGGEARYGVYVYASGGHGTWMLYGE